jgi:peroxiredoxin
MKFFRGHFSSYCVAHLRRWETLRPELDARGARLITLCPDTREQIRKGRGKHGTQAVMLSDADLHVTDLFDLRNEGNATPKGWTAMPIPTTILVDAGGIVRWIDQATDYRVLGAIREALG